MTRKLPSRIPFAALLAYSPTGNSDVSQKSRKVCYAIKGGREATLQTAVTRLVENLPKMPGLDDFFGDDVILVPMPRSAPLHEADALWPGEMICKEIVRQGLADRIERSLKRLKAVPKSSFARRGERPGVMAHLKSMDATPWLPDTGRRRVTVVDDVVTRGRTLYAGSVLVREAMPTMNVRAFGLVRTMGYVANVDKIVAPVVGTLRWDGSDADRYDVPDSHDKDQPSLF